MADIEGIAATLHGVAAAGMTRKALVAAVRERHPGASKKLIVRAAFHALTSGADGDAERALRLQDFALGERMAEDGDEAPPARPQKKHRRKRRHGRAAADASAAQAPPVD